MAFSWLRMFAKFLILNKTAIKSSFLFSWKAHIAQKQGFSRGLTPNKKSSKTQTVAKPYLLRNYSCQVIFQRWCSIDVYKKSYKQKAINSTSPLQDQKHFLSTAMNVFSIRESSGSTIISDSFCTRKKVLCSIVVDAGCFWLYIYFFEPLEANSFSNNGCNYYQNFWF